MPRDHYRLTEAQAVLDRFEAMDRTFGRIEPELDAISWLVRPKRSELSGGASTPGYARLMHGRYTSLGITLNDQFSTRILTTMMNAGTEWQRLSIPDKDLARWPSVAKWLDRETTRVMASFGVGFSNFYSQAIPFTGDTTAFGFATQLSEFVPEANMINDQTLPLHQARVAHDQFGRPRELAWKLKRTAAQAVAMFGAENVPTKIYDEAKKPESNEKFEFVCSISPSSGWIDGALGARGRAWPSLYVSVDPLSVVRESGYFDRPFSTAHWFRDTGEDYGRGQAWAGFPSLRVANLQEQALTQASQFAAQPLTLASDERTLAPDQQIAPGARIYNGVRNGRANIDFLSPTGNIAITAETKAQKVEEVREAWNATLFNLQGRTGVTSEEWFDQRAEALRLMAPQLTNLETMWIAEKIAGRFALLMRLGQVDPVPPELAGQPLQTTSTSALALAQQASDGAATIRLLADMAPLVEMGHGTRVMDRVDPDEVQEILVQARGAPAKILRDRAAADQLGQQRATQQQMERAAELAPGAAQAAATLSEMGAG